MRITSLRALAGVSVVLALTQAVGAQVIVQQVPGFVPVPFPGIRAQTTVRVPDGATVTVAGYSRMSESRNEYGAPGFGRLPYGSRLPRNVGYGGSVVTGRITATVRVIDLPEMDPGR